MNTITICRLVGYAFLAIATLVEIIMFYTMFNVEAAHWGKLLAVILTPVVFNISIWGIAIFYYKVKKAHTT